jgi:hypothetical protein
MCRYERPCMQGNASLNATTAAVFRVKPEWYEFDKVLVGPKVACSMSTQKSAAFKEPEFKQTTLLEHQNSTPTMIHTTQWHLMKFGQRADTAHQLRHIWSFKARCSAGWKEHEAYQWMKRLECKSHQPKIKWNSPQPFEAPSEVYSWREFHRTNTIREFSDLHGLWVRQQGRLPFAHEA